MNRPKFTWKDHLRAMIGDEETNLRMRIKHLNSKGYGDENAMVQALQRQLGIKIQEKVSNRKPEGKQE